MKLEGKSSPGRGFKLMQKKGLLQNYDERRGGPRHRSAPASRPTLGLYGKRGSGEGGKESAGKKSPPRRNPQVFLGSEDRSRKNGVESVEKKGNTMEETSQKKKRA